MGKFRYILIFGVLGNGLALGLGTTIALMMSLGHYDWRLAITILGTISLIAGLMNGARTWNELLRVEAPFPLPYHPSSS